jgi:pyrophosphatase PpaX
MSAYARNGLDLLILDLDGTLVDSAESIVTAATHAFDSHGLSVEPAWIRAHLGAPLEELWKDQGGAPDRYEGFETTYRAHYGKHGYQTLTPFPEVAETLRALAGRVPMAVATTKPTAAAVRTLEHAGILVWIDGVHGTDDLPHKPDPAVLLQVLARFGVSPDRAMMVGDTHRDVLAGRAAGTATCAVTYGAQSATQLGQHGPDHIIDRFGALPDLLTEMRSRSL